jgi:hypothetical protein
MAAAVHAAAAPDNLIKVSAEGYVVKLYISGHYSANQLCACKEMRALQQERRYVYCE